MIELHRAKMGISTPAQNGSSSASSTTANGNQSNKGLGSSSKQDERLRKFLTRLKHTKPTVPPSLTRRILNKQGVGYVDPLVSTVVSSAADRFLATVLSQALGCRDRRLKGEELAKKEKREKERVRKRRRAEERSIANKKRKLERELQDMAKKGNKGPQKQDKKVSSELTHLLGTKTFNEVGKKDSVHEEEEYYEKLNIDDSDAKENDDNDDGNQSYEEDEFYESDDDEDDEDRDILQLRDLVRPLEAWGLSLTGKMGLATEPTIKNQKEKSADNDDDNVVGLDGDVDAGEGDDEEDEVAATVAEKTPTRKKKAGSASKANSPAPTKKDGKTILS